MGTDRKKEGVVSPPQEDRFQKLKLMGYCLAFLPPQGIDTSLKDFVEFAKYQLCKERHLLMKDPIWETYGDEEILVEYYAVLFEKNQTLKAEFEAALVKQDVDFMQWLDKELRENEKKRAEENEGPPEFEFDPSTIGE